MEPREAEILRHLGGDIPTNDRIRKAHSRLPLEWLNGEKHAKYAQSHGEACFICVALSRANAAEAERDEARRERDECEKTLDEWHEERLQLQERWDAMQAEVARLSAALERIANTGNVDWQVLRLIAREALRAGRAGNQEAK